MSHSVQPAQPCLATVVRIDPSVEEAVTVRIADETLTCICGVCPYAIEEGKTYPVRLTVASLDGLDVGAAKTQVAVAEAGDGFSYRLVGLLDEEVLRVGPLEIEEDDRFEVFAI